MTGHDGLIDRREAIRRVSALLGGITFVGGSGLLAACERARSTADGDSGAAATGSIGDFTPEDVALLDEVADTMLPETSTPGAKAAHTGAFMAVMVTDCYDAGDQRVFREGMRTLDAACRTANGVGFLQATPAQRLALLERLDREQKAHMDARAAAQRARSATAAAPQGAAEAEPGAKSDEFLPDQRQENAPGSEANAAPAITADSPAHYFRMMKELALLGYFTSEIGCKQAQRYVESPGRFDPCVPYTPGERAWAGHA
ncbi:MAG TPA: gluconate 2-dehydrogenase subunit 3 family protein [Gemmatimonadaceae bacterium]|nr:gluconate 2-dehydrogenase subunit 3 family protein [Gemmatimonadaceae bacterium]